jgi:AcrR family transcriptional regulator
MIRNAPTTDLRVQRTRKLLRDALIALTIEKGFAAVTVQDIVERAMVNRATFYRHYQDKYDLVTSSINEVLDELDQLGESLPAEIDRAMLEPPAEAEIRVYQHFADHADFYRALLGKNGLPSLSAHIRTRVEQIFARQLALLQYDERQARIPLDLCLSFISNAAVGSIIWWLEHDLPYSAEQMALWLGELIGYGVNYGLGFDVAVLEWQHGER